MDATRGIRIYAKKSALLVFGEIMWDQKLRGKEGARELRSLGKSRKYHPTRFCHVLGSFHKLGGEANQVINGYVTTTQSFAWPRTQKYRHLVKSILHSGLQTTSKLWHTNLQNWSIFPTILSRSIQFYGLPGHRTPLSFFSVCYAGHVNLLMFIYF
jgi:hypothetical protein